MILDWIARWRYGRTVTVSAICAWCKHPLPHSDYTRPRTASDAPTTTETTHGICPSCLARELKNYE